MTVPFIHLPEMQGPRRQLPMPNIPMPAGPQAPPSWWQRAQERMLPVPEGLRGLLSEDEIKSARNDALLRFGLSMLESGGPTTGPTPSLGQAIARGVGAGVGGFDDALKNTAQMKMFGQQQQQAAQLREKRAAIAQKYPPQPNETAIDTLGRIQRMLPEYIQINDTEMVGKLVELLKSQGDLLKPATPVKRDIRVEDNVLGPDGKPYKVWYDNDTNEELKRERQYVAPKDTSSADRQERRLDAQNINQVLDDYRAGTGKTIDTLTRVRSTVSGDTYQRALKNDAAAQIAILYAFVNLMDETAVREGEQAMVRMAGPAYEQAKGFIQRNLLGESFSVGPTLLKQMYALVRQRMEHFGARVTEERDRAIERARILGIPEGHMERLIKKYELPPGANDGAPAKPSNPLLGS